MVHNLQQIRQIIVSDWSRDVNSLLWCKFIIYDTSCLSFSDFKLRKRMKRHYSMKKVRPPSAQIVVPVMWLASDDAKNNSTICYILADSSCCCHYLEYAQLIDLIYCAFYKISSALSAFMLVLLNLDFHQSFLQLFRVNSLLGMQWKDLIRPVQLYFGSFEKHLGSFLRYHSILIK